MERRLHNFNKRGDKAPEGLRLEEAVDLLRHKNLPQLGRWEMAKRVEPISSAFTGNTSLDMTAVVHEESYFVLHMRVSLPDENCSGTRILIEAIEKHHMLPEVLLVRDEKLYKELMSIARGLTFRIERVRKLKAIPQTFRAMTSMLIHDSR